MSKSLVAVLAAGVGLIIGTGLGVACGVKATAELSDKDLEALRQDIGLVPKENTSDTSNKEEEKVEG